MDDKWIQRRIYRDTFRGGEFHLEMTENLSADAPFQKDKSEFDLAQWRSPDEQALFEKEWELLPVF